MRSCEMGMGRHCQLKAELESSISIIIPAFNVEASIGTTLSGLGEWQSRAEVLVVDDGSTDCTGEIAKRAGVRVIRHMHNKGYRAATGDIIVMMDADGEHNAGQISTLLGAFDDNDMVVGARGKGSHAPMLRRPGKWLLSLVANYLAETKIPDLNSGFRAFRRDVALRFLHLLPNGFSFTTTLTLACFKEGYNTAYVPITTTPRVGKSTVSPIRDGFNTIMLIIRIIALFDPIKVFLPTSIALFLIGLIYWVASMIFRYGAKIDPFVHIPTDAM